MKTEAAVFVTLQPLGPSPQLHTVNGTCIIESVVVIIRPELTLMSNVLEDIAGLKMVPGTAQPGCFQRDVLEIHMLRRFTSFRQ